MNRKASPVSQINFICIKLKYLLFRIAMLKFQRNHGFRQFPPPGPLRRKKETPRQLHIQCARTLGLPSVPEIRPRRSQHSDEIKSRMLEESLVFRSQQSAHQQLWQIIEVNRAPLLPRLSNRLVSSSGSDFRAINHCTRGDGPNQVDLVPAKINS